MHPMFVKSKSMVFYTSTQSCDSGLKQKFLNFSIFLRHWAGPHPIPMSIKNCFRVKKIEFFRSFHSIVLFSSLKQVPVKLTQKFFFFCFSCDENSKHILFIMDGMVEIFNSFWIEQMIDFQNSLWKE